MAKNLASKLLNCFKLFHFAHIITYKTKYLFCQQHGVYKETRCNIGESKLMVQSVKEIHKNTHTTGFSKIQELTLMLSESFQIKNTTPIKKDSIEKIKLEKLAFSNRKQELMNDPNFKGRYVAVLDEDVIDSDLDFQKLTKRVYKNFGYIPILIEKIDEEIVYGTSPHLE